MTKPVGKFWRLMNAVAWCAGRVCGWLAVAVSTMLVRHVGSGGERLFPEVFETLQAQVDALTAGTNPCVYFPKGQRRIPELPPGARVTEVKLGKAGDGLWFHHPSILPQQIRDAVSDGTFYRLLGIVQSKKEAGERNCRVVFVRDENGLEIKSAVVDASNARAVAAQADVFARQFPGKAVTVEDPIQVWRRVIKS